MANTATREAEATLRRLKYEVVMLQAVAEIQIAAIRYGVQPTPSTCPACGAPRTCCAGAKGPV